MGATSIEGGPPGELGCPLPPRCEELRGDCSRGTRTALAAGPPPHSLTPCPLESPPASPQPSSPKRMKNGSPSSAPHSPGPRGCDRRRGYTGRGSLHSAPPAGRGEKRSPVPDSHFAWSLPLSASGDLSPPLRSPSVSPGAVRARGPWLPTPTRQPQSPVPAGIGRRVGRVPGPPLSPGSQRERAAGSSGAGRGGRPRGR